MGPPELGKYTKAELALWGDVIRKANISLDYRVWKRSVCLCEGHTVRQRRCPGRRESGTWL